MSAAPVTSTEQASASSSSTSLMPSLATLKSIGSAVGNKINQAKSAIERGITEAVAMFPIIDLTAEEPVPAQATWYSDVEPSDSTNPRSCLNCTYAGSPPNSKVCALCNVALPLAQNDAKKPRSSIYPSLSDRDNGKSEVIPPRQSINAAPAAFIQSTNQPLVRMPVALVEMDQQGPSTWDCPRCTLRNANTETNCAACGGVADGIVRAPQARRTMSLKRASSVEHGWPCGSCTFLNPPSGNVCMMCSKPKKLEGTKATDMFEAEDVEELRRFHEEEARAQWEGIMVFCRNDRSPFVDDRFPPIQSSLVVGKPPPEFNKVTGWLRPSQLRSGEYQSNWTVCRTPMASDIQQGFLGDCWFLCALSVVAERPALINNVIITRDYNREGAYLIRLCVDGLWKIVLLDDLFPVEGRGQLAFSKAGRNQLWVPLIEKALAKAHRSYYAIEGGFVNEGLMFLTGAPCDRISLDAKEIDSFDSIWGKLLSCFTAGFLMGASCGKPNESMNEEECKSLGLRPRHSYSVLDVQDVEGHRLVRLRDPWGRQAWKGDWSDRSRTWTPELRRLLMPHGGSEGLFWISLPDFLKFFDSVDISKYREHYKEIRVQGAFPNNALHENWAVWNLTVTETTEVDFTLYQQGYRGSSNEVNAHHLDLLVLVLACGRDRRITKLVDASRRTTFSFVGTSCLLDPGNYIIWTLAFNHWNDMLLPVETFPKNVIAFHSGKSVMVERLSPPPFALADAVIHWSMRKGTRTNDRDGITHYCVMHGGLVLVYENRYPTQGVQLVCDCTQSRDTLSSRGVLYTVDYIPPLSRMVICVLSPTHGSAFYIHFSTKNRLCQPWDGLGEWGPPGTLHFPEVDTDLLRDLHAPRPLY